MFRLRIAVVLGAIIAVLLPAAPANAAALEWSYVTSYSAGWLPDRTSPFAYGYFTKNGRQYEHGRSSYIYDDQKLWVIDYNPDGHRVGMHWRLTDGSRRGICVNKTGDDGGFGWACAYSSLPEGRTIEYRTGRCNGSEVDCGDVANWKNWGVWKSATT